MQEAAIIFTGGAIAAAGLAYASLRMINAPMQRILFGYSLGLMSAAVVCWMTYIV